MTEKEFRYRYIKENLCEYLLNVKPCCFLKEDEECEIKACKLKIAGITRLQTDQKDYLAY
jgi:hypothetical protein